ncbi:MAG TPA: sugar ABC transporter substrate-binding protein, partial [Bacteroidota bacterium]
EFAKFLLTPEHDLLLLEIANQIPVRRDLLQNPVFQPFFKKNPDLARFAEQAAYTRGIDEIPDLKEILDALSQEYEACAVFGAKPPGEAVENIARRARLIMEWNE